MTALAVRGLRKAYGAVEVLKGVDLDVPEGTLTAVLGPSGCGKTTLLRLVAGFAAPDAGTIELDGRPVCTPSAFVPAEQRRVGYVPQEGALFPHLDVARNIAFGLPRRERRPGGRVDELLELVGLDASVARRFPHELSGGQQQRVALARALAPRPALVLLDEPFSSLDAALRAGTGRAVRRALQASGATAVLVTHDQDEALSLADQVAVVRAGRLVQVGTPAEVYGRPSDPEVAAFVGGAVLLPGRADGGAATSPVGALRLREPATGEVDLLVRPEQLLVLDPGAPGVDAVVREVSYYGHDASLLVEVQPAGPLVTARVTGGQLRRPGDHVRLRVDDAVPAFPRSGSATGLPVDA